MREQSHENVKPAGEPLDDQLRRAPSGDARPDENDTDALAPGIEKPRSVEDRPSVSSVTPASYPDEQRAKG